MNQYSCYQLFKDLKNDELKITYGRCIQNSTLLLKSKSDYMDYFNDEVNFVKFLRVINVETLGSAYCKITKTKFDPRDPTYFFEKESIIKVIVESLPIRKKTLQRKNKANAAKIGEKPLQIQAKKMFQKIIERSKRRGHDLPKLSFETFFEWIIKSTPFEILFAEWDKNGRQEKEIPSVNRIDNEKGYSLKNMEVITWGENDALNLCEKQMDIRDNNDGHWSRKSPVDPDSYHLIRNESMIQYLKTEKEKIILFGNTQKIKFGKGIEILTANNLLSIFPTNKLKLFSEKMNCVRFAGAKEKFLMIDSILMSLPCPRIRGSLSRIEVEIAGDFN